MPTGHPRLAELVEAVISCGDRRLGKVIETAWRMGETLSAWEDYFDLNRWMEAFEECGLDLNLLRQPPLQRDGNSAVEHDLPWRCTGVFEARARAEL